MYAGLFANLVFPLRPGELLRSYIVSDAEEITLGRVLGSVGVERLVDLVIATASLAVVSLLVDLPQKFRKVADTLGIITLVLLAIVVMMIYYLEVKLSQNPDMNTGPRHLPGKLMRALLGLHAMGTAPSFYAAVCSESLQFGKAWAKKEGRPGVVLKDSSQPQRKPRGLECGDAGIRVGRLQQDTKGLCNNN